MMKPKLSKMTCRRVTALVSDYLSHELDPHLQRAFDQHISTCGDCVSFLRTYQKTLEATRALRCEELPADLRNRAAEFVRATTKKKRRK